MKNVFRFSNSKEQPKRKILLSGLGSEVNGSLPGAGYPKVVMNSSLQNLEFAMVEADCSDADVTNVKIIQKWAFLAWQMNVRLGHSNWSFQISGGLLLQIHLQVIVL